MADAILRHMVAEAGLGDKITVDSAGTGSWHVGETASPGTLAMLYEHNIPYDGRSRQLAMDDFTAFDYILAMDRDNLAYIMRVLNRGEGAAQQKRARFYGEAAQPAVALFLSYANRAGTVIESEVSDPYYHGDYEATYELVRRGCQALFDALRAKHQL